MDDHEFVSYCDTHIDTSGATITTSQVARLCRLAGYQEAADAWDRFNSGTVDLDRNAGYDTVCRLIAEARVRLAKE